MIYKKTIATAPGEAPLEQELSESEVKEFLAREEAFKKWRNSLEYKQYLSVSQREYPSVGDQLDMIYKDKINNTNVWLDTITAIKEAHPKPEK